MTHIVGKLDGVLRKIADQREEAAEAAKTSSHSNLRERILETRKLKASQQVQLEEEEGSPSPSGESL